MVIWCGDIPLVVDHMIDFVVNPLRLSEAVHITDISDACAGTIGKKVMKLTFLSANIAELRLEDNTDIVFASNYMGADEKECFARMKIETAG